MGAVKAPRLLVCSPASGGGKTTFACGLMQALADRGLRVQACKCGPDYIDPMFHRQAIGVSSRNLDLFFMDAGQVRGLLAEGAADADVTVIEGAMGYYDGIAVGDEASAWDIARVTDTPAVLVVDARGRARSVAAEVLGFLRLRQPSQIAGVVLNRVSPSFYPRLKQLVEAECGVPVLGYLPVLRDCSLESRHLGLVPAAEVEGLRGKLARLAGAVERCVDVDALLALAGSAPDLAGEAGDAAAIEPESVAMPDAPAPVIAVARDEAFCFYYDDTLRLLEKLGAHLVEFSPLTDAALPAGTCGLYLGGGYPELHARELSSNTAMRAAVRNAVEAGMPTIAECGGFMYLHEWLEDDAGMRWPMAGVVPGASFPTGKLGRFGYVDLVAKGDSLLAEAGDSLPAHEFHYWDSDDAGDAFHARKPQSTRAWDCVHATPTLYAGYPHLCLHARPAAAARFVRAAAVHGAGQDPCATRGDAAPRQNAEPLRRPTMGRFEHGGDAYGLGDVRDFSASLNPLGMPEGVRAALRAAAEVAEAYPDPHCRELAAAVAEARGVPASWVLPCAGATDAIARACQALSPRTALVCAPCYSGYEQALSQVGAKVVRYRLKAESDFAVDEGILPRLADADAVFLANPNNPTGLCIAHELLERIVEEAAAHGTAVVLDESFLGFTGQTSIASKLGEYPNLVVVRSFTKLYAMAGVRLGYLLSADAATVQACRAAGQPWAVSTAAQKAGVAALQERGFAERTRKYVARERAWLAGRLCDLGFRVVPSQANYLLFEAPAPLHGPLRECGILVRACGNFPGLDDRWHRVAVRTRDENRLLVAAVKEVLA